MTFSIIAPVHFGWFVWSLASPLTAGKQQCVGPLYSESSIRHEGRTFSPTAHSRKYSGQSCALFTDTTLCDLWIIKYVQTCTWTVLMWTTCSMLSEETREWGHLQCKISKCMPRHVYAEKTKFYFCHAKNAENISCTGTKPAYCYYIVRSLKYSRSSIKGDQQFLENLLGWCMI